MEVEINRRMDEIYRDAISDSRYIKMICVGSSGITIWHKIYEQLLNVYIKNQYLNDGLYGFISKNCNIKDKNIEAEFLQEIKNIDEFVENHTRIPTKSARKI